MAPGTGRLRSSFAPVVSPVEPWAWIGVSEEAKKAMIKMMVRGFLNTTLKGYHIYLNMQIMDVLQPQYLQVLTYKQKIIWKLHRQTTENAGKTGFKRYGVNGDIGDKIAVGTALAIVRNVFGYG